MMALRHEHEPWVCHKWRVERALRAARTALRSAEKRGRRTGCLAEAVRALEGALRCVEAEDRGEV